MALKRRKATKRSGPNAKAAAPRKVEFPTLPPIKIPDGRSIRRGRPSDQPVDDLNCCRIKGYVAGSVVARAKTGGREIIEDHTMRNGANASASALTPNTYDTAADAGSLIETNTRQEANFIVHIVTYTAKWLFEDWVKSVSIVCDYAGDVFGRQEWLMPQGSFEITTSTAYDYRDFNPRNLAGVNYRFVVVDQTGEMLVRTLFIPAPPPV